MLKLYSFIYIGIINRDGFNVSCTHKSIFAVLVCKNQTLFILSISVFASSHFSNGGKWDLTGLANPSSLTCRLWNQSLFSEQLQKFPFSISDPTDYQNLSPFSETPKVKILPLASVLCLSHVLESKMLKD